MALAESDVVRAFIGFTGPIIVTVLDFCAQSQLAAASKTHIVGSLVGSAVLLMCRVSTESHVVSIGSLGDRRRRFLGAVSPEADVMSAWTASGDEVKRFQNVVVVVVVVGVHIVEILVNVDRRRSSKPHVVLGPFLLRIGLRQVEVLEYISSGRNRAGKIQRGGKKWSVSKHCLYERHFSPTILQRMNESTFQHWTVSVVNVVGFDLNLNEKNEKKTVHKHFNLPLLSLYLTCFITAWTSVQVVYQQVSQQLVWPR